MLKSWTSAPIYLQYITMKVEEVAKCVYLDVQIGAGPSSRLVIRLFDKKAPHACRQLFLSPDTFIGAGFTRIVKNFMIQVAENVEVDLTIENPLPLDRPFLACPSPGGFFISTYPLPHLTGKHSVVGEVIHGKSLVREIERLKTLADYAPEDEQPVIVGSGPWEEGDEVPSENACYDQIGGDIYEEYPDDDQNIDKESSKSVFEASEIIKLSGDLLLKKGESRNALLKYKKALRYVMEYIPDEDQDADYFTKFSALKKKLFLNMSLSALKQTDYESCVRFGQYLMDMALSDREKAKVLFRVGSSYLGMRKFDEAVESLEAAAAILDDAGIHKELVRANEAREKRKQSERAKYSKFFGS